MQLSKNPEPHLLPSGPAAGPEHRQRQRLLWALVLFLCAIGVVLYKNRTAPAVPQPVAGAPVPAPAQQAEAVVETPPDSSKNDSEKTSHGKHARLKSAKKAPVTVDAESYTPTVSRKALPPLAVEVFAGGRPVPIKPNPVNAIHVDTSNGTEGRASSSAANESDPMQSAEHVRISPQALQVLSHPVDPNYPLLAREMKVQGSVVLDAVIGRDGTIQTLKIVSGPTILANAAMEAVRQWRFKPYLQAGEAVETEARITVNFTISTT